MLLRLLSTTSPFAFGQSVIPRAPEGAAGGAAAPAAEAEAETAEGEESDSDSNAGDENAGGEGEAAEGEAEEGAAEGEGEAEGDAAAGTGEIDMAEIEVNGKKFFVPKELEPHVMMDKDYRHKTMAAAEEARKIEAERTTLASERAADEQQRKVIGNFMSDIADLRNTEAQINEYAKVDFIAWGAKDPDQARQHQIIRDELIAKAKGLGDKIGRGFAEEERKAGENRKKFEDGQRAAAATADAENRKNIKDWSPVKEQQLKTVAMRHYGYSASEIANIQMDPRMVRALNDLAAFHEIKAKTSGGAQKSQQRVQQGALKPVPKVNTGGSVGTKDPERMTGDEYLAHRRKQDDAKRRQATAK